MKLFNGLQKIFQNSSKKMKKNLDLQSSFNTGSLPSTKGINTDKKNVHTGSNQSNYSDITYDYGKNIISTDIQENFRKFLQVKDNTYNKDADNEFYFKASEENNIQKKVKILKQGVQAGSALCALELGNIYLLGQDVTKNLIESEKYLIYAAKCGLPNAMNLLGILYTNFDEKVLEALDWMCKAVIRGSVPGYKTIEYYAQNYDVKLQIEARLSVYFMEIYDKENKKGCENRFMGWCYYAGICCVKNKDLAKLYWEAANKQNDVYCSVLMENL